jgi:hypothetical protein
LANGLRVSELFENKLILDVSWYEHRYMKSTSVNNREFELDYFPAIRKIEKHVSKIPKYDEIVGKFERRLNPSIQTKIGLMTESNAHFFINPPRIIDGSFEQINYLPKQDMLQTALNFPEKISSWFEDGTCYNASRFVVALHVRRTDYINLAHIYDVIDTKYYLKAIDFMMKKNNQVKFHLFSDDPDGAIKWLGDLIQFDKIITPPKNIPSGEVLRFMSTYNGIIAANSTFSWWAAFLGHLKNKKLQIVLPSRFSKLENDHPERHLMIDGAVFL